MKSNKNLFFGIVIVGLIIASYFTGSFVKEQAYNQSRLQRCNTLISFALDKVENADLSDEDIMEALISNIYAAYEFCDDSIVKQQLHGLWNDLIFENKKGVVIRDQILNELTTISKQLKIIE